MNRFLVASLTPAVVQCKVDNSLEFVNLSVPASLKLAHPLSLLQLSQCLHDEMDTQERACVC